MGRTSVRPRGRVEFVLLAVGLTLLSIGALWSAAATLRGWEARAALASNVADDATSRVLTGVLDIPRLRVSAAIGNGDDVVTLALSTGHLPDTSVPWLGGNTAIAGHRDRVFRALRDIRTGDRIELHTTHGAFAYAVRTTRIVSPADVSVVAPTPNPQLTLVTCYPFTFFGHAPDRFIVIADRTAASAPDDVEARRRLP